VLGLAILAERREVNDTGFRYAVRLLCKRPGYTVAVMLTLGLGIGATTAIFSVFHAVLLKPLPYTDPERLVTVWETRPTERATHNVVSSGNYLDWYDENEVFSALGAYSGLFPVTLGGADPPTRVTQVMATPSLFATLGVSAQLGRVFGDGGNEVRDVAQVLISHALWESRFAAAPDVVGRTVEIEETRVTIAGVMPASFTFPGPGVQLWAPLSLDAADRQSRKAHQWRVVGRIRPDVGLEQVRTHMDRLADGIRGRHPQHMEGWGVAVYGLHDDIVRDVGAMLWLILTVVVGTLLIACVNVANLMLARMVTRQREWSLRTALGAGKGTVIRQVLGECGMYAALGGALGISFAYLGLEAIVAFGPEDIPRLGEAGVSGGVLGVSLLTVMGTTVLVGALPAMVAASAAPARALSSGKGTLDRGRMPWQRALVVGEVALACALTVCAGLLVHSFIRVLNVQPGYQMDGLLMAEATLPESRYAETDAQLRFHGESLQRLEAMPQVLSVAGTAEPPVVGYQNTWSFVIEGVHRSGPDESEQSQPLRAVTPGYFRTLGIPLLQGRAFVRSDGETASRVAIVNQSFADLHWPDSDAVGKRLSLEGHAGPWIEVVGVVADTRHEGLDRASGPAFYVPYAQKEWGWMSWMTYMIRTKPGHSLSAEEIAAAVADIDPNIALGPLRKVEQVYARTNSRRQFAVLLMGGFASLALALGMIGIHGTLAYSVERRRREYGIRMAVGSDRASILAEVLRTGLKLTAAGLLLGMVLGFISGRLLSSQLYEISSFDPLTFGAVPLVIALTAFVAGLLPALRASRTNPADALREE
jgi:putative ABC transport system permease protein